MSAIVPALASAPQMSPPPRKPAGAYPWIPDPGDGTFRNPILLADYSDPDVLRQGDDFYLIASSFNCTPGLPVLHSRDLVNWTIVGHALRNLPHRRYRKVQPGCGVWAPSIRFHDGKVWIFFAMPDEGIYVTTATQPAGEWSKPRLLQAGKGLIDPCPLWDDNGKAFLVHAYAFSRAGIRHKLRVRPMAPDASRLLGEGQIVFDAPERQPTIEGPKFFKRAGWYYILAPAGGVRLGWQTVLRAPNVYGPYEEKIVLEQGSTPINGPHQGALVDLSNGEWWFVHFQDAGVYGRVVHLQPASWNDGWPVIGRDHDGNGIGEPVARHPKPAVGRGSPVVIPQTSDEFDAARLGLQWQWPANYEDGWYSLTARKGWLRLFARPAAQPGLAHTPHLLLQKFPARSFTVETSLELSPAADGEEAGLVVMGRAHAAIALRRSEGAEEVIFRKDSGSTVLQTRIGNKVRFFVQVKEGGKCAFAFAGGEGGFTPVREVFQAQAGEWIGAKVGLYALSRRRQPRGHADFDCFRFSPASGAGSVYGRRREVRNT